MSWTKHDELSHKVTEWITSDGTNIYYKRLTDGDATDPDKIFKYDPVSKTETLIWDGVNSSPSEEKVTTCWAGLPFTGPWILDTGAAANNICFFKGSLYVALDWSGVNNCGFISIWRWQGSGIAWDKVWESDELPSGFSLFGIPAFLTDGIHLMLLIRLFSASGTGGVYSTTGSTWQEIDVQSTGDFDTDFYLAPNSFMNPGNIGPFLDNPGIVVNGEDTATSGMWHFEAGSLILRRSFSKKDADVHAEATQIDKAWIHSDDTPNTHEWTNASDFVTYTIPPTFFGIHPLQCWNFPKSWGLVHNVGAKTFDLYPWDSGAGDWDVPCKETLDASAEGQVNYLYHAIRLFDGSVYTFISTSTHGVPGGTDSVYKRDLNLDSSSCGGSGPSSGFGSSPPPPRGLHMGTYPGFGLGFVQDGDIWIPTGPRNFKVSSKTEDVHVAAEYARPEIVKKFVAEDSWLVVEDKTDNLDNTEGVTGLDLLDAI